MFLLFSFLLLIFPSTSLGQWGTPPPIVTNQQCQEEQDKILGCVRNHSLFQKFDDPPLSDPIKSSKIVDEITHVLDCSEFLNCNSSRILQSYFFNQRWIIDHYYDNLEACLSIDDLQQIQMTCIQKQSTPMDCNRFIENLPCQIEQLKTLPNCGSKDVKPFKRFLLAWRSGCVMMHQWMVEAENYKLKIA
ncbi:unnamed protein product [Caenorhabditis brenneri]